MGLIAKQPDFVAWKQQKVQTILHIHAVWSVQGSHKLWKSKKITKNSSMHGKIMEFEKKLNYHGKPPVARN